jgi:probable rRNA maturation factor
VSERFHSVAFPKVTVRNFQRKIPVNVVELQNFAAKAIHRCLQLPKQRRTNLNELRELFVCLISDRRMASLHREFVHKSGPTDVITFQHGEIFISVETAKRHARSFETSLTHELRLYLVHGVLHLHGFDDHTETEARKMERTQEGILKAVMMLYKR